MKIIDLFWGRLGLFNYRQSSMKLISVQRKTRYENRYTRAMGQFRAKVTSIKLVVFNLIPFKTVHRYRETYYGEVKDCAECNLSN